MKIGRIICLALFLILPVAVHAAEETDFWSNQPEALSERYYEAYDRFDEDWVLGFADTLEALSDQHKQNEQMKYYASVLKCHHAFNEKDSVNFFHFNRESREYALRYGLLSEYFSEILNEFSFYMNAGQFHKAQSTAKFILSESRDREYSGGRFYGYMSLGLLHARMGNHKEAIDSFDSAANVLKDNPENANAVAQMYSYMAFEYINQKDYEKAVEYAQKAEPDSFSDCDVDAAFALAYYFLGDYDKFRSYSAAYEENLPNSSLMYTYYCAYFSALRSALDGNYDEAYEKSSDLDDKWTLWTEIAKMKGDWKAAYEYSQIASEELSSDREQILSDELEQMDSDLGDLTDYYSLKEKKYVAAILVLIALATAIISIIYARKEKRIMSLKEKELESSRQYKVMVDNAPFGYSRAQLIYDEKSGQVKDYRTLEVNRSLQRPIEASGLKIGSKTILESYPVSGPVLVDKINEALKGGLPYTRFLFHLKEYHKYYETIMFFDTPGYVRIVSLNTTDLVKARKSAENAREEMRVARDQAERFGQIKTQFVQNMSHEIRTPLNAIVGFSQLLGEPDGYLSEDERLSYTSYVRENSEYLLMLIDDILDIADADSNNYKITLDKHSCNDICRSATSTVEHRVPRGVELRFSTDVDDSFTLLTDAKRVKQVLVNYLTNACKHTEKGYIELACSSTEIPGKIVFSVADTGTGVPADKADAVFERFVKLDEFKQGAGLGLYICRIVAEKLGAEVRLDTSYTSGARFLFILDRG